MLVSILRDQSAEPTTLDLSLNFSTEQEIDQGGFGMVYGYDFTAELHILEPYRLFLSNSVERLSNHKNKYLQSLE